MARIRRIVGVLNADEHAPARQAALAAGNSRAFRSEALAIAMVRDLTETKRSAHEGRFFEFLFKLIGDADSSHQVLTAAVQTICHFTRCAIGQVWLPAGDVLVCSPTWFCSGYGFEKLHAASEEVTYEPGQGLPGLAWARRQPLLLEDVRDLGRFDRAFAAQRAGVREALAVPVTGAEGVVAVLELFVTHERAGEPGRLGRIARVAEEFGPWSSGAGPARPWPPPRSGSSR